MSMKACLFYHFCCVGISPEENSTDSGEKIGTNGGNGFPRYIFCRIFSPSVSFCRIARSQSLTTLNDPRKLAVQRSSANTWSAISLGDAEKEKRRERQLFRDNQKEKHEQFFRNWDIHESDREIVEVTVISRVESRCNQWISFSLVSCKCSDFTTSQRSKLETFSFGTNASISHNTSGLQSNLPLRSKEIMLEVRYTSWNIFN